MHTPSLDQYVACLEQGDIEGVGRLMLASADKLARAGADFLICPDNTIHQGFGDVHERSPLPWLHIAQAVAAAAVACGPRRLGLLGTARAQQRLPGCPGVPRPRVRAPAGFAVRRGWSKLP